MRSAGQMSRHLKYESTLEMCLSHCIVKAIEVMLV